MAGFCAYSLVNLLPGGRTSATGNTAARGGAAALVDAAMIVQAGHTVTARGNAAHTHGGAFALLAGASLALLEDAAGCPSACQSSSRGGGYCTTACMSIACNWDGGDCVKQRMLAAGTEAGQACDRDKCLIFWQTNARISPDECVEDCFTAACDWSRENCVEPRNNVRTCPLIDAAAYASIQTAQRYICLLIIDP